MMAARYPVRRWPSSLDRRVNSQLMVAAQGRYHRLVIIFRFAHCFAVVSQGAGLHHAAGFAFIHRFVAIRFT